MTNRTLLGTTGLAIALVLFLLVNALSNKALTGTRLDLTEGRLYTLSDGSRRIVAGLDEPVTLRFYYSEKQGTEIPPVHAYAERVRGLLREYVAASGGKVRLVELEPEPFSEVEDAAVEAGLQGAQANPQSPDLLYFGLVATGSTEEREVIPFFDPRRETSLEYDISRLILKLGSPTRPIVAVISSLPLEGQPALPFPGAPPEVPPWFILESLGQIFDVRVLPATTAELPEGCQLVMVVHPKQLAPRTQYAIDQFVLKGGHALVFTDPFCEADQPPQDPSNPMAAMMADRSSNLDALYTAWGVRVVPGMVVGDRNHALQVRTGSPSRPEALDYVAWLGLGPDALDRDDFVTAEVTSMNVATAGVLEPLPGATTEFLPLVKTSPDSMLIETQRFQFQPDPRKLLTEFAPDNTPKVLAARVRGTVRSAFPDGRPAAEPPPGEEAPAEPEGPDPGFVAESTAPINVILVSDVDLLQDQWWVQMQNFFGQRLAVPTSGNGDFVANALDNLAGSNDLISVRSRKGVERPFERVEELRREADQRFLAKEQELTDKLRSTEQRINELQAEKQDGTSLILSPEQRTEIERFRAEQVATRKQLRDVQHDLRKDIDTLEARIKFINIGLVPLLLGVVAVALGSWRSRRRE